VTSPAIGPTTSDRRARTLLLAEMLSSYGFPGDSEATVRALLGQLSDITLPWLRTGLERFKDEPGRVFAPTLSEIRTAVARAAQATWREARGIEPGNAPPSGNLDVAGCLKIAREKGPRGPEQLLEAGRATGPPLLTDRQPPPQVAGSGDVGDLVMDGLDTGHDFQAVARDMWAEGHEVPARSHRDRAHGMQGCCMALSLAKHRAGYYPCLSSIFNIHDWERYDRAMRRHVDEGGEGAWWAQIKAEWKIIAMRSIAGQGPARGRRNR